MTNHAAILCCLLLAVSTVQKDPTERVLYALDTPPAQMTRNNVDTRIVPTDRGKATEVRFHHVDWPNVYFSPSKGTWDWTASSCLAVDIYNPESSAVQVYARVDNAGADGANFCTVGAVSASPRAWTTLRLQLNDGAPVLWGMRGLPGAAALAKPIDLSRITAFQVFLDRPDKAHTLILARARLFGRGGGIGSDVQLPFVDRFGQYKHADWPGKLKGESDFASRIKTEQADLKSHPGSPDRDAYGGWLSGPKLKPTGWFRTQRVDGRWWLVTPEGHLFFSVGMDCIDLSQQTFVTQRGKWFEWLPAADDARFGSIYGQVSGSHSMAEIIGGKGRTFSFYTANLVRGYGTGWQSKWRDLAYTRLGSWGFNTIANWSRGDVMDNSRTPFTACAHINADFRRIEGGGGYWGKMMDVYDPKFPDAADSAVAAVAKRYEPNHYCLGYFVDNELSWESVDWATLASPAAQPCRVVLMKQLQDKYSTIDAINKAWGTTAKNWDDLRAPAKPTSSSRGDLGVFTYAFARRYFETVKAAIRSYDKRHLYLGCRFSGEPPQAVARACADIADVVSYNIYAQSIDCNKWSGDNYLGKPVIIGEFHFGALDRGMFHPGLVDAKSQQGRADSYAGYVRSAADCPSVVGCAWFQYIDEPITGRYYDGENYNIGFVDVTDRPYPELVESARKVNSDVYRRHSASAAK